MAARLVRGEEMAPHRAGHRCSRSAARACSCFRKPAHPARPRVHACVKTLPGSGVLLGLHVLQVFAARAGGVGGLLRLSRRDASTILSSFEPDPLFWVLPDAVWARHYATCRAATRVLIASAAPSQATIVQPC